MKTVAINKGGRKPKTGVDRYPGGQIVHSQREPEETEDDIKATVLEARMRRDLGVDPWLALRGSPKNMREARKRLDDPLRHDALGRLLLLGRRDPGAGISQIQFDASGYFARVYVKAAPHLGLPNRNPRSVSFGMVGGGFSTHPEGSAEYIEEAKQKYRAMDAAIRSEGGTALYDLVAHIVLENGSPESINEVGALRLALNAINRARGA